MNREKALHKDTLIQIATPFSTGIGFYCAEYRLIVTADQVVEGNREVVVGGPLLKRQPARVVYTDPLYRIALLATETELDLPPFQLAGEDELKTDEKIFVLRPLSDREAVRVEGAVCEWESSEAEVPFLIHNAMPDYALTGGPLFTASGKLLGVNISLLDETLQTGLSLPSFLLKKVLDVYTERGRQKTGTRCGSCHRIVLEHEIRSPVCPGCGSTIKLPVNEEIFEPGGICRTIENILTNCGYDVRLARRGLNQWEILHGSARITVSYYEPNGLIAGDAVLCLLPPEDDSEVLSYLLSQNHEIEGLTLSLREKEVILSLIIYDRYLNVETGIELFRRLFQTADDIDNVLVERYGCGWVEG